MIFHFNVAIFGVINKNFDTRMQTNLWIGIPVYHLCSTYQKRAQGQESISNERERRVDKNASQQCAGCKNIFLSYKSSPRLYTALRKITSAVVYFS